MKLSEIQQLIKFVSKSGVSEVEIESKDFKINIRTHKDSDGVRPQIVTQMMPPQAAPALQPATPAAPDAEAVKKAEEESKEANYVEIKSPMIGTFYRRTSPESPELVKVGDTVNVGDHVCVIEAMKLFNEIESEFAGKIVKVLVDDGSPVEYDQPLFLVEPTK